VCVRSIGRPEVAHHEFDGRLPHLCEDDEVDVADGESALRCQFAHEARPTFVVISGG